MAGIKIVKSNCPECDARVNVDPQADQFTCEYCGTVARIENRKNKAQAPPPPVQPGMVVQPIIRVSSGAGAAWLIYVVVVLLMITGVGGVSMWRVFGGSEGGVAETGQSWNEHMQWVGNKQPMLVDVNGDGVMDVIGWIRFVNTEGGKTLDHLGAFNGVDGARLWTTPAITDSGQQHQMKAGMSGNTIVVADATGVLKAYATGNGQLIWTVPLGERAQQICGEGEDFVRVETMDDRVLKVTLATGQLTPAGQVDKDAVCGGVQSPDKNEGPYFSSGGGTWSGGGILNPEIQGMDATWVLVDKTTGATVALGSRKPGTRVPTAALYTEDNPGKKREWHDRTSKGTAKWLTNVPAVNPLKVAEGGGEIGAISRGRLIIPYDMQDSKQGARLSCLDINTGRNLWDIGIPRSDTGDIDGLNVSDRQIFVGHWTYLDVFDLGTGKHQYTIGVW